MGDEGLESGQVLRRDVGLVEDSVEFLLDFDLLPDLARETDALLADVVAMSFAAKALVGADASTDSAEVAH